MLTFFIAPSIINRGATGENWSCSVSVMGAWTGCLKAYKARTSTVISLCLHAKLLV